MAISDFRTAPADTHIDCDICVVGSGPAGMTIALQFVGTPIRVCMVESGGLTRDTTIETLSAIENVGAHRVPPSETRQRGLGGTSALWSGRCGVFDPIDYRQRAWVQHSGWPISADEIEPYYDRAGRVLGLGPAVYQEAQSKLLNARDLGGAWDALKLRPVIWQFSQHGTATGVPLNDFAVGPSAEGGNIGMLQHSGAPSPRHFGQVAMATLKTADNINVLLHATAVCIETNETAKEVGSVTIASLSGRRGSISARRVVLACGGIDNARLLLCSQTADHRGLGNQHGLVGRFLSDHPFWPIASYSGRGSDALRRRFGAIWYDRHGSRHVYTLGLRLSPEVQRQEQLLNAAVHIVELGTRRPAVTHAGSALRLARQGRYNKEMWGELASALRNPIDLASGAYSRYALGQPPLAHPDVVQFGVGVEQVPDPESRVLLSKERDAAGMHRARLDWRISDREFATARRLAEILKNEFARLGYEPPSFAAWLNSDDGDFRKLIHDMAHPMGTTRMSADANTGVVDANSQVHGVSGLYVAGSSVFTTSGYMNPTLMIVALSLRLADHLKSTLVDSPVSQVSTSTPLKVDNRRLRIGIIGSGNRIRNIYLPILRMLDQDYEIVGITSRSADKAETFAGETNLTAFESPAALVAAQKPDLLIAAVTGIDHVLPGLLDLGTPLFIETPFCWSLRHGRNSLQRIVRSGLTFGVAEQTPYLPIEQLKRLLLDHGLLGTVVSTHNDFAVFDYHGIAALKAHLGREQKPASVSATRVEHPTRRAGAVVNDAWTFGTATCADGCTLVHHYSDQYFMSEFRQPKMLRLYGSSGSVVGDMVSFEGENGVIEHAPIRREMSLGRLQTLTVTTPLGEISWRNPFAQHDLDDESIAVATSLQKMKNAVLFGGVTPYSAEDGYNDMELLAAMRSSALNGGAPVKLPLGKLFTAYNALRERLRRPSR